MLFVNNLFKLFVLSVFSVTFMFANCPDGTDVCLSLSDSDLNYESTSSIAGVQFNHDGCLTGAAGGDAENVGGKIVHNAPNTTSKIISKSISKNGGRTSYRGLIKASKDATNCNSNVVCDALMLDEYSQSDTYPYIEVDSDQVNIEHEARVSKIGEEQLFYLMSRGLSEEDASAMIVNGFIEPLVKELPMEYAVELNKLIQLQMEGSIG